MSPTREQVFDAWIAALRSRKYKQGQKVLRRLGPDGPEFCCLGVLCDLGSGKWEGRSGSHYVPRVNGELDYEQVQSAFPTGLIMKMMRLTNAQTSILMTMNDAEGKSFDEIADYLESIK